jgi:hypothetical protein
MTTPGLCGASTGEGQLLFVFQGTATPGAIAEKPAFPYKAAASMAFDGEERGMAEHAMEVGQATGNDYAEHDRTYRFFLGLVKWGTIFVVIVLILMAIFLL